MAVDSRRGKAWQALRLAVLERDSYICAYCGNEANTADHVIPVKAGGKDEMSNLVACCTKDNSAKGARLLVRMDYVNRRWLDRL